MTFSLESYRGAHFGVYWLCSYSDTKEGDFFSNKAYVKMIYDHNLRNIFVS